ncbi:MAG: hypothetical protein HRU36_03075 [Rickettsiales bacterium]|nr:hypothetical protein [Rickettsiales bacterium]
MIVSKDTHLKKSLYFLGAIILKLGKKQSSRQVDFFDIYIKIRDTQKIQISVKSYVLAWDLLYLLGAVENNSNGKQIWV